MSLLSIPSRLHNHISDTILRKEHCIHKRYRDLLRLYYQQDAENEIDKLEAMIKDRKILIIPELHPFTKLVPKDYTIYTNGENCEYVVKMIDLTSHNNTQERLITEDTKDYRIMKFEINDTPIDYSSKAWEFGGGVTCLLHYNIYSSYYSEAKYKYIRKYAHDVIYAESELFMPKVFICVHK